MKEKEILIVGKLYGALSSEMNLQLISQAYLLAGKTGCKVSAFLVCDYEPESFQRLYTYGVDQIYFCSPNKINDWMHICDYLEELISKGEIETVLFPAMDKEREIAAYLSVKLECGLTADCIDVDFIPEKGYVFSRAAMNDSVIAQILYQNCKACFGTIKEGTFQAVPLEEERTGSIIELAPIEDTTGYESKVKLLETVKANIDSTVDCDITKASVVFCIGRGVRDSETVKRIRKLADKMGAELVATRAIVEENLIERQRQVGQSGKSIAPKIYIGIGVSGACQHIVGIKNAELIIAINNDPNAPIFQYADYSIIADLNEIVAEMEQLMPV